MKYSLLISFIILSLYVNAAKSNSSVISGKIGSVSYELNFGASKDVKGINSYVHALFNHIDSCLLSTNPNSRVYQFNENGRTITDEHFYNLFYNANLISANTNRAYNPTDIAYEKYWAKHDYNKATQEDSFQVDSIYKYNVFSGFIEYDSIVNNKGEKKTVLATEDFAFPIGFDEILAAYKLELIKFDLLNNFGIALKSATLIDDNLFLNNKLRIDYKFSDKTLYTLSIKYNYGMDKHGNIFAINHPQIHKILCDSAVAGASYLSALHKTGLNNNHQYWSHLLKIYK